MNRNELRSRTATTVATYALLSLAGGVSLILPDSVVPPATSAAVPVPLRSDGAGVEHPRPGAAGWDRHRADDPAPARYD